MICYNAGFVEERQATVLGIGLEEGNFKKMLVDNLMVFKDSKKLGYDGPTFFLFVVSAVDEEGLKSRMGEKIEEFKEVEEIACLKLNGPVYFSALSNVSPEGDVNVTVFLVGMTSETHRRLRNDETFRMRVRRFGEDKYPSVEFLFFFVKDRYKAEEEFIASGLVGKDTKIIRS